MATMQDLHDQSDRLWHSIDLLRYKLTRYTEALERQEHFSNVQHDFLIELNEQIGQLSLSLDDAPKAE